jgi:hypothetical protein
MTTLVSVSCVLSFSVSSRALACDVFMIKWQRINEFQDTTISFSSDKSENHWQEEEANFLKR